MVSPRIRRIRRISHLVIITVCLPALLSCRSTLRLEHPERLVLVSYDGTGAELVRDWLDSGIAADPNGFAGLAKHGFSAQCMRPVNPTLTSVSHASLITGGVPAQTGIVSNLYHPAGTALDESISGFLAPLERQTLWQAAHAQGKRVGVLLWPGGLEDGVYPDTELGLLWPDHPLVRSSLLELEPEQAGTTTGLSSHDQVAALLWQVPITVRDAEPEQLIMMVVAYDGNDDGKQRYDTVACRLSSDSTWKIASERQWFPLEVLARGSGDEQPQRYGSWCKVLQLDRHQGRMRLLQGSFNRLLAYPELFRERLEAEVGFWPGEPDSYMLSDWWLDLEQGIDLDTFLEQLVRLDRYLDRIAELVLASEQLDLIITYHPGPDEYQHACKLVDQQQWAYSPGSALAAREGLKQIGASVDLSVSTLWHAIDPQRDALVVLSDHGLTALHDVVYFNQVLADAGLVSADAAGDRMEVAADSPMKVVASGGCAHLYLNLQGREPAGVVDPAEASTLLQRAAQALADVDGSDGLPVVEEIISRSQAGPRGLDHPNSGDLIIFLRPGYTGSSRLNDTQVKPTSYYGQHGHLNHHDELCGMLFARGAGVRRDRRKEVASPNVATLVATWMGIDFPLTRTGE